MRLPGVKLAQRSFRRARSRLLGGVAVLGYHQIADIEHPLGLAVSRRRFAAQVDVLARTVRPMHLSDAARALREGSLPTRGVVVTFDDGYRDTLEDALPVIERACIPVTVFVTTGAPGREFWWDELTRIVMESKTPPYDLKLEIPRRSHPWTFDSKYVRTYADGIASRRAWLTAVASELRVLSTVEREDVMCALRAWAGRSSRDDAARPRALTVAELQQLAASPYIEIGAHTVSHPMLPFLPHKEQQEEVQRSRSDLQRLTGSLVTGFSYPHGAYSDETVSIVAETGFIVACCSTPDVLRSTSDVRTVPRLWVGDQDGESFSSWLHGWLRAPQ
jgi:peptidoglycan/xylan/chitin deacetylase (PgdA/CDA1 family)